MPAPSTPTNFLVQEGNGQVWITADLTATATTYPVYRSTNGTTFVNISSPVVPEFLDTTVIVGTKYFYFMTASNGTESTATATQTVVPTLSGQMTLGQIRLMAQQRADRVNSNFVTTAEWNQYISQSYYELYDLLVTLYENYYVYQPIMFQTSGAVNALYPLPTGLNSFIDSGGSTITPPPFYKLLGVDLGLATNTNAWVTIKNFEFVSRNRYVFPQLTSTYLGVFNLRYKLLGNNIMFIPSPSAGQYIRLWYVPRVTQLLKDTDILDSTSGWSEYIVVDAAIKALEKEESDVSILAAQKMMLIKRIEESAVNRDAGMAERISDVRTNTEMWGGYGAVGGDGPYGGF